MDGVRPGHLLNLFSEQFSELFLPALAVVPCGGVVTASRGASSVRLVRTLCRFDGFVWPLRSLVFCDRSVSHGMVLPMVQSGQLS